MVTIVRKGSSIRVILEKIRRIKVRKKLDAHKYCGSIKILNDPLELQKLMRNEWN